MPYQHVLYTTELTAAWNWQRYSAKQFADFKCVKEQKVTIKLPGILASSLETIHQLLSRAPVQ